MPLEHSSPIAVFDLGGTWFRWGLHDADRGLVHSERVPAINHLSHPTSSAIELQMALLEFLIDRAGELAAMTGGELRVACVSIGAPVNAHTMTVLGSGPLWGPTARPFELHSRLVDAMPELQWHVVNDITALLALHANDSTPRGKTMLVTVSSGIGCRIYDHGSRRIPYDPDHGVQGEIGHLTCSFELDGKLVQRQCECGGRNHLNAFSSGRGIALTLRELAWSGSTDDQRLQAFQNEIELGNDTAIDLLHAIVTPLSRTLATALTLDPEIDRIVITGGVAHGLGAAYREALQSTFLRDGLYQISDRDPHYLKSRLLWDAPDPFAGLTGAGVYARRFTRDFATVQRMTQQCQA